MLCLVLHNLIHRSVCTSNGAIASPRYHFALCFMVTYYYLDFRSRVILVVHWTASSKGEQFPPFRRNLLFNTVCTLLDGDLPDVATCTGCLAIDSVTSLGSSLQTLSENLNTFQTPYRLARINFSGGRM